MRNIQDYIADFPLGINAEQAVWQLIPSLANSIKEKIKGLSDEYNIHNDIAIHQSATIENGAIIKGPAIIGPKCFIAAHSYLRAGVYLQEAVVLGPGVEIKHSFIGKHTHLAHFNFIGDSIIGANVNFEAGAIICNHYNEREDKQIKVSIAGLLLDTGLTKFGAIIGDEVKIGANAVLSPGSLLLPKALVARLALVQQSE